MKYLLITLTVLNVVAFLSYGFDKYKAMHHKWRTPEARLLALAVLGGSVGALLGMLVFRHKTQHLKFKYGLPAILIVQMVLAYSLFWS